MYITELTKSKCYYEQWKTYSQTNRITMQTQCSIIENDESSGIMSLWRNTNTGDFWTIIVIDGWCQKLSISLL